MIFILIYNSNSITPLNEKNHIILRITLYMYILYMRTYIRVHVHRLIFKNILITHNLVGGDIRIKILCRAFTVLDASFSTGSNIDNVLFHLLSPFATFLICFFSTVTMLLVVSIYHRFFSLGTTHMKSINLFKDYVLRIFSRP